MHRVKYTIFFLGIFLCSCNRQIISDITGVHGIVKDVEAKANSEESRKEREKLLNENILTSQYYDAIESSGKSGLIKYRDLVLSLCGNLSDELESSIQLLKEKHGTYGDGNLRNRKSSIHVNKIFIEEGRGSMIKISIGQTIDQLIVGGRDVEIDLTPADLPLKLNLFMEQEGKTWEEYFFQDMPAAATLPILEKFKKDVTLTKLDLIEIMAFTIECK